MTPFRETIQAYEHIAHTLFVPNERVQSVEDIRPEPLIEAGYKTLFLDVDNTLVPYGQRLLSLQKIHWVEGLKMAGLSVFLVSNNSSHRRIKKIADQLSVYGIYFALKPFSFSLNSFAEDLGVNPRESVVIGDQVLTDILVGNWIGAYTILCDPAGPLSFFKVLQQDFEKTILSYLSW